MFGDGRTSLVAGLEALEPSQWQTATACPGWTIQDIAVHVVGDDVGRLPRTRDGFVGIQPHSGEDLAKFIDRINDEWVVAARRMSPQLLLSCLQWTGSQVASMWRSYDLDELGEPVSWAGPDPAPMWLDAARDFTEYWVHHQQIREAVGRPVLLAPHGGVVVNTFLRALPYTLRFQQRPIGTRLTFEVDGTDGNSWTVERDASVWVFVAPEPEADCVVRVDMDTAWRLCTRAIEPDAAKDRAVVSGDEALGRAALEMVSIIRSA